MDCYYRKTIYCWINPSSLFPCQVNQVIKIETVKGHYPRDGDKNYKGYVAKHPAYLPDSKYIYCTHEADIFSVFTSVIEHGKSVYVTPAVWIYLPHRQLYTQHLEESAEKIKENKWALLHERMHALRYLYRYWWTDYFACHTEYAFRFS